MTSIRSKAIIWLLKNRHLLQFKLKPEVITTDFSVVDFRNKVEAASERMSKSIKDVRIETVNIDGMAGEWIIPTMVGEETTPPIKGDKVLLYIHGGGFISGSCMSHRAHVSKFARGTRLKTLVFDYRLAPEHPYPAALDDAVKAYEWLLGQGYSGDEILVAGESAGGTLTLSLLLALKSKNMQMPKAAVSISPVTDLTCSAESFVRNAKKDIAPMNSWTIWTGYYVGETDVHEPLLSPIFGDLSGLPPLNLVVGTNEIHYDDTVNFAKKAEEAGVEVELDIWDEMVHAFPILAPIFPEATRALDKICKFLKRA